LEKAEVIVDERFGFQIPKTCGNVPSEILNPKSTWKDPDAYEATAKKLANMFHDNFQQYTDQAHADIIAAGPKID
jgi:phosphoenolpyruvate carboxykinase (ATP)